MEAWAPLNCASVNLECTTVPVYKKNSRGRDCRRPVAEGSDAGFLPVALS